MSTYFIIALIIGLGGVVVALLVLLVNAQNKNQQLQDENEQIQNENEQLQKRFEQYRGIINVEEKAKEIIADAKKHFEAAKKAKSEVEQYQKKIKEAEQTLKKINQKLGQRGQELGDIRRFEREQVREKESHATFEKASAQSIEDSQDVEDDSLGSPEERKEWTKMMRANFKRFVRKPIMILPILPKNRVV